MSGDVCRIPIAATMEIVNGKAVMTSAEYAEISADSIARYLIEKFGITPIFSGSESDSVLRQVGGDAD